MKTLLQSKILLKTKKNNFKGKSLLFLLVFFFLTSCDFSNRVHRQVLEAQALIQEQKYDEAIKEYFKILNRDPPRETKVKVYYQLGDLYSIYLSQNKESIKYYEKVKEISEDPYWLIKTEERLGEVSFVYTKDFKKSFESYQKLTLFKPDLEKKDFYQFRAAVSLFQLEDFKQAKFIFNEISNSPKHQYKEESLFYLGQIYFREQKWEEAIRPFNQFTKISENLEKVVQAKFLIANCYETLENLEKAYMIYYSLIGIYPNSEVIRNRLESIYKRRIARKR